MKNLRYLKPIFSFFLIGLSITTISRILLFFVFKDRVVENQNFGQLFLIGLRFDLILMCYIAFLPTVLISLLPDSVLKHFKKFFNFYFIFFLFLFLLLAGANRGAESAFRWERKMLIRGRLGRRMLYRPLMHGGNSLRGNGPYSPWACWHLSHQICLSKCLQP